MPAKAVPAKTAPLADVYDRLQALLKSYAPPFTVGPGGKVGSKRHYDLVSTKDVVVAGRKHSGLWFASLIEQKAYVGFYFMPVYMAPSEFRSKLSSRLRNLLKGKSCFQVKSLDSELLADIKAALDLAQKHYQREGWV